MSFKGSKIFSILNNKCPKCHEGDFFVSSSYFLKPGFLKMNKKCAVCDESFEKETGYYFGAMYVSYGLTVFFGIIWYLFFSVILNFSVLAFLLSFSLLLILFLPFFFQLSRLIWINIFVHYDRIKFPAKTNNYERIESK